jgi:mono/diheme cytochrome c family protein
VVVVAGSLWGGAFGQPQPKASTPLVITSLVGRDLFDFYCASCHGRDLTGTGPVAEALKTSPTDLTTIAKRNRGVFPKARVAAFVTGDDGPRTPVHGSKDMPVWGPIFRGLDPRDTYNAVRIANIVDYIESQQKR